MGFQTYTVIGNLTEDPAMQYVGEGNKAKTTFSVACNQRFGKTEETLYVDCEAWERTAEFCAEYFRKGSSVVVRGRWKKETWEAEGGKRSKYFVKVDEAGFAGPRPRNDDEERPARRNEERPKRKYADDDLPF